MIDDVLTAYFQIFTKDNFLIFIAFGISSIVVYALFSFFDD